ncbi:MAG TPA: HIT domain-containing protein [Candidatus Krumholzibacteriaceae bacterium]|nr:HIT domain-containing protein [Candidatus Krumholzibacteriaceae bacterium]
MDRVYAPWRSKYFSMPKESGCLFCDIQKEREDARVGILQRGDHWFTILNIFPYTNGHIMVVAKRHINNLSDITGEEGVELIQMLARAEQAIDKAYNPDGMNVGVNRGAAAGAGITGHLHFHIVPRWKGDTNFMSSIAEIRVVSEELGSSYDNLKSYFDR